MKKALKFWMAVTMGLTILTQATHAQQHDEDRMQRDIEVAENVLATLIKREMGDERTFFGLDVRGAYQPGYGVTFRLPPDHAMPFVISIEGNELEGATVITNGNTYRYSYHTNSPNPPTPEAELAAADAYKLKEKSKEKRHVSGDSLRSVFHERLIEAAREFIVDYGDFLTQLGPSERIVVTNQGDRPQFYFATGKRTRISVEGMRADVTALRQGKISREQAMKKLTVVNTESVEEKEPDMEMLSSIFSRLYRPDLSKTYFLEGNVYYERLKDYGAIFYMQMVSSVGRSLNRFQMPTVDLDNVDQETRDQKVKELYPVFEQDLKENILEYGRTVKSLNDSEILFFNISLTRCKGCGIPGTLEISIPANVLKDFGSGKIGKSAALEKFTLKKGAGQ
ncbi:MAG: hypothetical protein WA874_07040 [Chryseosolibacter sp.]